MTGDQLPQRVAARLAELRSDYATGAHDLARLDEQRETLQVALLRISGAIQALSELSDSADVELAVTRLDADSAGDLASSA